MFSRLLSLWRLLTVWRISDSKPDEAADNPPDCIIMLAFGQELIPNYPLEDEDNFLIAPGPANEAIARIMANSHAKHRYIADNGYRPVTPILAQWEFTWTQSFNVSRGQLKVKRALGSRHDYKNTREILIEAKEYMAEQGWQRALLVAHPYHLPRCIWTADRLGIEVVHDARLTQDIKLNANVWNSDVIVPDDQTQTTSLARWVWHELMARTYFWLRGEI